MNERGGIVSDIEQQDAELRILRRQFSECQEQRGQQEVRQTQLQLRIDNVCEHIQRRYQIDLREFRPDGYALFSTIRDVKKRQRNKAEAVTNGDGEAAVAPEAEPAPVAAEAETTEAETREAAQQQPEEGIDWSEVERLAGELGQRLDSMGPINVDAIQEYDELEQRHTFLEQQLADLANSKAELMNVIAKINVTTRQLFADTFEQVRVNFQEMFRELFGEGGKANLVLMDESDPLESGIDIIAKPPGKQLQSISLLSGGERTMTAVSLLFAIYMVKPSPFCVLDEMDAPLDESNINRFIKILDRFVSQSQFVVITHNKRTIAKADVIYGVTMEEHGVSKLVGVRFSKREESAENNDIIGTRNATAVPSLAESFGKPGDLASEAKAG
jgi:chromosome segregation protein